MLTHSRQRKELAKLISAMLLVCTISLLLFLCASAGDYESFDTALSTPTHLIPSIEVINSVVGYIADDEGFDVMNGAFFTTGPPFVGKLRTMLSITLGTDQAPVVGATALENSGPSPPRSLFKPAHYAWISLYLAKTSHKNGLFVAQGERTIAVLPGGVRSPSGTCLIRQTPPATLAYPSGDESIDQNFFKLNNANRYKGAYIAIAELPFAQQKSIAKRVSAPLPCPGGFYVRFTKASSLTCASLKANAMLCYIHPGSTIQQSSRGVPLSFQKALILQQGSASSIALSSFASNHYFRM